MHVFEQQADGLLDRRGMQEEAGDCLQAVLALLRAAFGLGNFAFMRKRLHEPCELRQLA
ncbi:MAG: hypothetical protein U5Q44_04045 [Dehalococcoidia bacterium]|nr:hypothetical protein [Dehalococcoidia bacterium]